MGLSHKLKILADWFLWFPVQKIISHMPLGLHYTLGWTLGNILYVVSNERRTTVKQEIIKSFKDRKLPQKELTSIVRKNFILFCKDYMEILIYPRFDKKLSARVIPAISGLEHLDKALSKKKGAILLHLHFGAMQLVLPAMYHRGYPIAQVGQSRITLLNNPQKAKSMLFRKIQHKRKKHEESLPAQYFYTGTSARDLVRWLGENKILDIAADGRNGSRWIIKDFLNRKAYFPEGPFRLAHMTGAAILPTFIIRQADNTHKVVIEKSLNDEADNIKQNNSKVLLSKFLSIAESYVRKYPSHFCTRLWVMHKEAPNLKYPLFIN